MPSTLYIGYAESDSAEGEAVTSFGFSSVDLDDATYILVGVVLNNDSGTLVAEYITVALGS